MVGEGASSIAKKDKEVKGSLDDIRCMKYLEREKLPSV
jgi:hypothetical protein